MFANASALVRVQIDYLLTIGQVNIGNWKVNSIDNFINMVALGSTEAASSAILCAGRIFEGLEA